MTSVLSTRAAIPRRALGTCWPCSSSATGTPLLPGTTGAAEARTPGARACGGECGVQVGAEPLVRRGGRARLSPHDQDAPRRQLRQAVTDEMAQAPADRVARHCSADGLGHDEAGAYRGVLDMRRLG